MKTRLTYTLLFFLLNVVLSAQTIPKFSFEPTCVTPNPGETFTIDFMVEDFEDISGLQFLIAFDESIIVPVTVSATNTSVPMTNIDPNISITNMNNNYVPTLGILFSWVSSNSVTIPSSLSVPTRLFSISFTVTGNIGTTSILDIPCDPISFPCQVITLDNTGSPILLTMSIPHEDGLVDVGGVNNCTAPVPPCEAEAGEFGQ